MSRKTFIQFAHLAKQIACFICLLWPQQWFRLFASLLQKKEVNYNKKVFC